MSTRHADYSYVVDVFGTLLEELPNRPKIYQVVAQVTGTDGNQAHQIVNRLYPAMDIGQMTVNQWAEVVLRELGVSAGREMQGRLLQQIRASRAHTHKLISGAVDALRAAGSNHRAVGLLSNLTALQMPTLEMHGLKPGKLVTHAVYSCQDGYAKPNRAAFELIAHRMNLRPDRCIMIDDMVSSILGAAVIGMHGVLIIHPPSATAASLRQVGRLSSVVDAVNRAGGILDLPLRYVHSGDLPPGFHPDHTIRVATSLAAAISLGTARS